MPDRLESELPLANSADPKCINQRQALVQAGTAARQFRGPRIERSNGAAPRRPGDARPHEDVFCDDSIRKRRRRVRRWDPTNLGPRVGRERVANAVFEELAQRQPIHDSAAWSQQPRGLQSAY